MAWFGKGSAEAETPADPDDEPVVIVPATSEPVAPAPVIFQPGPPIDDWDAAEDVPLGAGAEPAAGRAPALEWAMKARPVRPKAAPRTALQEKMAEIAEKHKDGPVEDMTGPIREALAANGRDVPDDWILAIAEGLRQHGPIALNLGGPGSTTR